jgi:hypothetical protein
MRTWESRGDLVIISLQLLNFAKFLLCSSTGSISDFSGDLTWQYRENELDFAHIGGEANATAHGPKDGAAGLLAQAVRSETDPAAQVLADFRECCRRGNHWNRDRPVIIVQQRHERDGC